MPETILPDELRAIAIHELTERNKARSPRHSDAMNARLAERYFDYLWKVAVDMHQITTPYSSAMSITDAAKAHFKEDSMGLSPREQRRLLDHIEAGGNEIVGFLATARREKLIMLFTVNDSGISRGTAEKIVDACFPTRAPS